MTFKRCEMCTSVKPLIEFPKGLTADGTIPFCAHCWIVRLEKQVDDLKAELADAREEVRSWKTTAMLWRKAASEGGTVVRNTGP